MFGLHDAFRCFYAITVFFGLRSTDWKLIAFWKSSLTCNSIICSFEITCVYRGSYGSSIRSYVCEMLNFNRLPTAEWWRFTKQDSPFYRSKPDNILAATKSNYALTFHTKRYTVLTVVYRVNVTIKTLFIIFLYLSCVWFYWIRFCIFLLFSLTCASNHCFMQSLLVLRIWFQILNFVNRRMCIFIVSLLVIQRTYKSQWVTERLYNYYYVTCNIL